jgi:altronate hydrolase
MKGFLRDDGRKGIRNVLVVAYLVECAHHVAREIVWEFRDQDVHLIGFPGCYRNAYATRMMESLCTHPNVGGVLLVSLGCEGFDRADLKKIVRASGRPAETVVIQNTGGTRKTIDAGKAWVRETLPKLTRTPQVEMGIDELVVGTICGGSDATSGLTANPAIGRAFDLLAEHRAAVIFEETGELIGCERFMAERAATPELAEELVASVAKAEQYYRVLGQSSFAPGNADGGITTQEEKSLGAYSKSGTSLIVGLLKPGDLPPRGGL